MSIFGSLHMFLRNKIDDLISNYKEPKLNHDEYKKYRKIHNAYYRYGVQSYFDAEYGQLPASETFYTRKKIRAVLLDKNFDSIFEETIIAAEKKEIKEKIESDKKIKELEDRVFFNIWHNRGIVYGLRKYEKRSNDTIFPVTEFFLKDKNKDHHIKLEQYDMPISNGQTVIVIYAAQIGKDLGFLVQYVNLELKIIRDLVDLQKKIIPFISSMPNLARLQFELKRYRARIM